MGNKHFKTNNREFRKKGMTILIKTPYVDNPEGRAEAGARAVDSAIKALKRRANSEGLVKDLRSREFYVSKGQKRRRRKQDAIMRERIRHEEELREWNPSALIGRHVNKKKKMRNRQKQSERSHSAE